MCKMEDLSQRIKKRYILFSFRIPREWMEKLEKFPNRSEWMRNILEKQLKEVKDE